MEFYGNIKRISDYKILKSEIDKLLIELKLEDEANKIALHCSGGIKRKLNLAIALIGQPKVILIDEPTSVNNEKLTHIN